MNKTPYGKKVEILANFNLYRESAQNDEGWKQFFDLNNVGLPLAFAEQAGLCTVKRGDGRQAIEDTWTGFCLMLSIDPEFNYDDLGECFEASPNEPI